MVRHVRQGHALRELPRLVRARGAILHREVGSGVHEHVHVALELRWGRDGHDVYAVNAPLLHRGGLAVLFHCLLDELGELLGGGALRVGLRLELRDLDRRQLHGEVAAAVLEPLVRGGVVEHEHQVLLALRPGQRHGALANRALDLRQRQARGRLPTPVGPGGAVLEDEVVLRVDEGLHVARAAGVAREDGHLDALATPDLVLRLRIGLQRGLHPVPEDLGALHLVEVQEEVGGAILQPIVRLPVEHELEALHAGVALDLDLDLPATLRVAGWEQRLARALHVAGRRRGLDLGVAAHCPLVDAQLPDAPMHDEFVLAKALGVHLQHRPTANLLRFRHDLHRDRVPRRHV
mmetsp:Transcript_100070/g.280385  ORF Transcript_100070/g.280385 Transcript_100070/m.280385 type:complete len:349 (+) Transcript_100070:262-1308(+)